MIIFPHQRITCLTGFPWALILGVLLLATSPGSAAPPRITNFLGMEFILVQPGTFMMGSPETEKHRSPNERYHKVVIHTPFYLQTTEVTLKQWRSLMGKKWLGRRRGTDNTPVTRVSFFDVRRFIRKLNRTGMGKYRLPTEAEWEYACRAGTSTTYSWGDTIDCSKAMYSNNAKGNRDCIPFYRSMKMVVNGPAPVKSFAPNPWGFYDMHGNVWEWCSDEYFDPSAAIGSKGGYLSLESDIRVKRGGSWYKYGWYLRSANRAYAHPGGKFKTTGFRLVRKAE